MPKTLNTNPPTTIKMEPACGRTVLVALIKSEVVVLLTTNTTKVATLKIVKIKVKTANNFFTLFKVLSFPTFASCKINKTKYA